MDTTAAENQFKRGDKILNKENKEDKDGIFFLGVSVRRNKEVTTTNKVNN